MIYTHFKDTWVSIFEAIFENHHFKEQVIVDFSPVKGLLLFTLLTIARWEQSRQTQGQTGMTASQCLTRQSINHHPKYEANGVRLGTVGKDVLPLCP